MKVQLGRKSNKIIWETAEKIKRIGGRKLKPLAHTKSNYGGKVESMTRKFEVIKTQRDYINKEKVKPQACPTQTKIYKLKANTNQLEFNLEQTKLELISMNREE